MMKYLDLTLSSPAENLACDEALLDGCEETGADEVLRFWESPEHFVVVGYANKIASEVNVAACDANQIPILRRCTGGGTVLQGQGCLNYSLILKIQNHPPLQSITGANQFILKRNQLALQPLVPHEIELCGQTDLAIAHSLSPIAYRQKFSGNSQRRKKDYLLFHGTFLHSFDLPSIGKFLAMPTQEPDYRQGRPHHDFVTNLKLTPGHIKAAMREIWGATEPLDNLPEVNGLVAKKYSTREWNWKFP